MNSSTNFAGKASIKFEVIFAALGQLIYHHCSEFKLASFYSL